MRESSAASERERGGRRRESGAASEARGERAGEERQRGRGARGRKVRKARGRRAEGVRGGSRDGERSAGREREEREAPPLWIFGGTAEGKGNKSATNKEKATFEKRLK